MAGHNKWSKVKHIKAKTDAVKGKAFTKVVREIIVAAKSGGGDPEMNASLRLAIQKAKDVNMPKDNIQRAVKKGVGGGEGTDLEEIIYEAYGPNGVALLICTLTDNRNRTLPNIRTIVNKSGGSMASIGAVSYLFEKKGVFLFDHTTDEALIIELATEHGAEDIDIQEDGSIEVIIEPNLFEALRNIFETNNQSYLSAGIERVPLTYIELDAEASEKMIVMIERLEEDDDVQNVYINGQF